MTGPSVFIITNRDRTVRWLGNAEEMAAPLRHTLASLR